MVISSGQRIDGKGYSQRTKKMPSPNKGDWRGDISREAIAFFTHIDEMLGRGERPEVVQIISENWQIDTTRALYLLNVFLKEDAAGYRKLDWIIQHGYLDIFNELGKHFWDPFFERVFIRSLGETDEPVTSDIKRLIRLPASLHGKTGFRVCRLTRDELTNFKPLIDALAFSKEEIEIKGMADITFDLGGEHHAIETDRVSVLPEYAAVFAALRGTVAVHTKFNV
jgi:DNA primase small subunit